MVKQGKAATRCKTTIIRLIKAFKELADEGVKRGDVRGYLILRQAALNQTQEDQVTTLMQGRYDQETVASATSTRESSEGQGRKSLRRRRWS